MLREILYSLVGLALLALTLDFASAFFDDPREPPRVSSRIPIIGHVIGVVRGGSLYYTTTSKQTKAEIYTLSFVFIKVYISNSQRLTPIIQRAAKTLSFRPFIQAASKVLSDSSDVTYDLFGGELVDHFSQSMRLGLTPGPRLDEQNLRMGRRALVDVDDLIASQGSGDSSTISLLSWVKAMVVQASSCGVFGEQHPFLDPKVEEAFWTWSEYQAKHFAHMDVFRVGYAARDIVFDAFRKYCRALPADVSEVVIQRERVLREAGVSEEDLAKQEASFCAAIFPNTAPTLYWSVVELFSRPEILHEVRREIEGNAVQRQTDASGNNDFVLDVASLKTRCPLLLSVFQETQRTRAINAMIRRVMDDTLLDGQYLLKKGNYLQIPSQPMHQSKSFWGTSAEEFDPYRFMANAADNAAVGNGDKSGSGGSVSSMFMPWGAAPHLCPARQFASTEIMLVMALLAMRVELRPTDKNGQWDRKTPLVTGDITTVLNPVKDLRVRVGARPEGIGKWTLEMGESRTKVPLASG